MDGNQGGGPLHCPAKEGKALRSLLGRTNRDWWPNQLSLEILPRHGVSGDPYGDDFDYAKAFQSLDYEWATAVCSSLLAWLPAESVASQW